ncbi:MAG: ATP-binding protein [Bacillota bacterium]
MRLAEFILRHMEEILAEWQAFAATLLPAAGGLDALALRDHARQILEAVARDLDTPQTREAQSEKSKGRAPTVRNVAETAAQTHAVLRARGGFDINQLVAEYRALRASVLRLWSDSGPLDKTSIEDMIRFNEAIDQAVAESVGHFHQTIERYRNLLLGMLGHDMRSPLNCIVMTASHLASLNAGEEVSEAAELLIRSGASMQALLDDLTDFNRTRLGLGLNVVPAEIDLAKAIEEELTQLRAAHPGRRIEFAARGDTRGRWDGARVQQILRNLVSNAIKYGSPDMPVRVTLRGEQPDVRLEVSNSGHIDPSELRELFEPLRRGAAERASPEVRQGLGLGLFIVREIAKAHGGEVEARSEGEQTTFAVRLPRQRG